MNSEEYYRARDIDGIKGSRLPAGRALQPGEVAALMAACENDLSSAGARDAAIIAIAYSCGLRREELVRLDLSSYDNSTGMLKFIGKRDKERTVYAKNGTGRALDEWIVVRGNNPGPLFYPINKGGRLNKTRLSPQAIYNIMAKRAKDAGVKSFSPHDMRRTFISDTLDAGGDLATLAKAAGHDSVLTTARYDRRPEAAKEKLAGLLHVPFRGRLVKG